jgi:nucleotide-binding universal stress UspA family protein
MTSISENIKSSFHDEGAHLATSYVHFARILVGTDFSKPAAQALKLAITIGEIFGSEIFIVHAAQPSIYGDGQQPMPTEILSAQFEAARADMKKLVASEPRLAGMRVRTTVDYGGAVDLIEQVAKDEKITLVVLGSHGANALEKIVLGSATESVLRKSSCPVLIVGPNCRAEHHPFRSIVFATDLEATGLRAAQYASALAEHVDGRLTLLHVSEKRSDKPGIDFDHFEETIREKLRSLLPSDVELFCNPKLRLEFGSPAEVITGVAESEAASLIVVGLRNRSALADHSPWSTLSHVIREAKCGVLVVRNHLL